MKLSLIVIIAFLPLYVQNKINDIPTCNIEKDEYKNDIDIIRSFPFYVTLDPPDRQINMTLTYAKTNKHGNIYYLKIVNQQFVPSSIFCLQHLKQLHIQNTPIDNLDFELPKKLNQFRHSLIELSITKTMITYLPQWISKLKYIHTLDLSNTNLTILPDFIGNLFSLEILDLSNNNLTSLPSTINQLSLLSQITLNNNFHLHSIQSLNNLPSLQILNAKHCSIEKLPLNISKLTDLYMPYNKLKDLRGIPTLGYGTNNRKKFDFHKNKIDFIPPQIDQVKNLARLQLNYNELQSLPPKIYEIKTLSYLSIRNNCFKYKDLMDIMITFIYTNSNLTLCCFDKKDLITIRFHLQNSSFAC